MKTAVKKQAAQRLKIISGQVAGLERLVREERYCVDVINQSIAARKALLSFEKLMLRNHLSTHVIEQVRSGSAAKAIKEVLSVYSVEV